MSDLAAFVEKGSGVIEKRNMPPTRTYVWPLFVGAEWIDTYTSEKPADRQTEQFSVTRRVERVETVTVPAGSFQTFVIVSRNKRTGTVFYEIWYSPEVRGWVRDRAYFDYGIRIRELTSFKLE